MDDNKLNTSTDGKDLNGNTVNHSDEEMINYLE